MKDGLEEGQHRFSITEASRPDNAQLASLLTVTEPETATLYGTKGAFVDVPLQDDLQDYYFLSTSKASATFNASGALSVTSREENPNLPAAVREGRALLLEAELLAFKKQYRQALTTVEQALECFITASAKVEWATAQVELLWLRQCLEAKEEPARTQRLFNELYQQLDMLAGLPGASEEMRAGLTEIKARLLHYKGLVCYQQNLYGEGVKLFREAQTYCQPNSLEAAKINDSLAIYYETIGNFNRSRRLLLQSLNLKREYGAAHHLAVSLQILGRQCLQLEHIEEARHYLQEAKQFCEQLDDKRRTASLRNDLIKIAMLQQRYQEAVLQIADAETLHNVLELQSDYGDTLLYKTYLSFIQGQFLVAEQLLQAQVLPLFEQFKSKKGYGITLRLQGALHQVFGRTQQAIETMSEAIAVFKAQQRIDELAKTYFELGKLYVSARTSNLAQQSFIEALKIAERNNLAYLVQPIEDELYRLNNKAWQAIVDKRARHQPLFESSVTLLEALRSLDQEEQKSDEQLSPSSDAFLSLFRVGQAMAAERELDPLLKLIREETERALNAERCSVFLFDKESNELCSRTASGLGSVEEIRFTASMGLAGYVFKTGEVVNIADAYADPRFNRNVDKKTGFRTHNLLCIPVHNRHGEPVGVFQVLNKQKRPFDKNDELLLQTIAASAGIAIENALLAKAQKATFDSFIMTLSSTIDARDPITAGHSERVADFSMLMGEALNLGAQEQEALRYASLLHDIGKIGVREDVLLKDGRLTVEEYKHIQQHARYTFEILNNIRFERHLLQVPAIAATHHEKVDGTGYFRGLKGNEIPLLGRVLALSDVFDAITSRRHYRNRMPFNRVLQLIRRDAGTHFDAGVVNLLFQVPIYRLAEVFVKERLFKKLSSVAPLVQHIEHSVTLETFEAILNSPNPTPAEQTISDYFSKVYYLMPENKYDSI